MNELPQSGWRDFATKQDVDALRAELRGELAELRGDMKERFATQTHTLVYTNLGAMLGFGGFVLAAARFT